MLAPRSRFLVDVEAMLCNVGGKMATKSAKMSQHRRQGANPRGFEGSAGTQNGRYHLSCDFSDAPGLGGRAPLGPKTGGNSVIVFLQRKIPRGGSRGDLEY